MTPDYEKAALKASEILDLYEISSAPVSPLAMLKKIPGVLVVSYEKMSQDMEQDRRCVINTFGYHSQDAFTSVNLIDGNQYYLVTYNQMLPSFLAQRALAREMGHIVLGHDGSRPVDVRQAEARAFANHLLVPRPLIHSIQAYGIRLTVEVLGSLTGCYDYCLSCMRSLPATHVPAELNRRIRDRFMPYIQNYFEYQRIATHKDGSATADFGSFMDGYEE